MKLSNEEKMKVLEQFFSWARVWPGFSNWERGEDGPGLFFFAENLAEGDEDAIIEYFEEIEDREPTNVLADLSPYFPERVDKLAKKLEI